MTTKPCIACGEAIQASAKRCPHCHFQQSRTALFLNGSWGVALIVLAAIAALTYASLREPVRWSQHASQVTSSEVKLSATERRETTDVACSALLKNVSEHAWTDLVLEANFFAADGPPIDTITQRARDVVLSANGEARVRVLDRGAWPAAEYGRCILTVRSASAR